MLNNQLPVTTVAFSLALAVVVPHPARPLLLRHEIDKLTASQRLDLNLEKG
jgi:hypothetical protein